MELPNSQPPGQAGPVDRRAAVVLAPAGADASRRFAATGMSVALVGSHDPLPDHPETATLVYTVIDGGLIVRVAGDSYQLAAGDTIVVQPGIEHDVRRTGLVVARAIAFTGSASERGAHAGVLHIPLRSLESGDGRLSRRGSQKILVVGEPRADESRVVAASWTQTDGSGRHPVVTTRDVELAVFDDRAAQDRHFHQLATEVYSVLRGTMTIDVAGAEYALTAGETIVVVPQVIHEVKPRTAFLTQVVTLNCAGPRDKHLAT